MSIDIAGFSHTTLHAKWIDEEEEGEDIFNRSYNAHCSNCGMRIDTHELRGYYNYCPNCGAIMN